MSVLRYDFDLSNEQIFSRREAAAHLGKLQGRKRPLHPNHVTRLMRTGIRGIPLPSLLVGQRRVTSKQACNWWVHAVTASDANARGIGVAAPAAASIGAVSPTTHGTRSAATAPLTTAQRSTLRRHGVVVAEVAP